MHCGGLRNEANRTEKTPNEPNKDRKRIENGSVALLDGPLSRTGMFCQLENESREPVRGAKVALIRAIGGL